MRFGIIIDQLRFGGVEKVAIEEAKALEAMGHEAVLIILHKTQNEAYGDLVQTIRRIYVSDYLPQPLRFSFRIPFFRFFSLFHISYAFLVRFVSLNLKVDVLICHGTFTCFSGIPLARVKGVPLVSFVWDPIVHILNTTYFPSGRKTTTLGARVAFSIGSRLDRWICKSSFRMLTASRQHVTSLARLAEDPSRVRLVVPGVHIRDTIEDTREPYAVLATAWKKGKDPEYVLELAQRVQELSFVLVGTWIDSSLKEDFMQRGKDLINERRVTLVGNVDEPRLLQLYSKATVFLQIRSDVGFGLPALEAAGQGCTFIIPEGQGVCDLFTQGQEGYVVSEKNTTLIIRLLHELSQNRRKITQMGRNAWLTAHDFSWRHHAEKLCRIVMEYYVDAASVRKPHPNEEPLKTHAD